MASPSVVQSASNSVAASSASITVTLGTAPTPGNILVAYLGVLSATAIATPAGWTQLEQLIGVNSGAPGNGACLTLCWQSVGASPPTSYTFNLPGSGNSGYMAGAQIFEISGAGATPILAHASSSQAQPAAVAGIASTGWALGNANSGLALAGFFGFTPASYSGGTLVPPSTLGGAATAYNVSSALYGDLEVFSIPLSAYESASATWSYADINGSNTNNAGALVVIASAAPSSSPSIRQSAVGTSSGSSTVSASFPNTPTPGNLLVAFVGGMPGSNSVTPPTGWTSVQTVTGSPANGEVLAMFTRVATVSESEPYTFTFSVAAASSDTNSLILYELTPATLVADAAAAGSYQTLSGSSTPSQYPCTVLGAMQILHKLDGASYPQFGLSGELPSSGWNVDGYGFTGGGATYGAMVSAVAIAGSGSVEAGITDSDYLTSQAYNATGVMAFAASAPVALPPPPSRVISQAVNRAANFWRKPKSGLWVPGREPLALARV